MKADKFICMLLCVVIILSSMQALAEKITIESYSNGNEVTNNFDSGIFSALSSGTGFFAIAIYKEDKLIQLKLTNCPDDDISKLNMAIADASDHIIKIFRFSEDGAPLCINKSLVGEEKNYKVYFNETFDNSRYYSNGCQSIGTASATLENNKVKITSNGTTKPRFGVFYIPYPEKNIIIEADFELPSDGQCFGTRLISTYIDGIKTIAYMNTAGLKPSTSGKASILVDDETIESDGSFKISLKINLESRTYDVYYNREKLNDTSFGLGAAVDDTTCVEGISVYVPILDEAGSIYVDNIRAYSGNEFLDIGNERANVNNLDFADTEEKHSDIYVRPDSVDIASKTLNSDRPRILLNSAKLNEIKNSNNAEINQWKEIIINKANEYIETDTMRYALSYTGSLADVSTALDMMVNLGMAYMLTGEDKYPDRAYKEIEVLYTVPFVNKDGTPIPSDGRDYWNSKEYLDVSEISLILAFAYDWMYDAWTTEQKEEIWQNILEKGLMRTWQSYYNEYAPTLLSDSKWWKNGGNWNPVCNGSMLVSAIAFMEKDAYMCANIAEAAIRALEYYLPRYAPVGAWSEGASYWAYALKNLTIICSTLDSVCGTDYGISKTTGLENSQFYALASEGKTSLLNFGDCGEGHVNAPYMLYWSEKYNNADIGGAYFYTKSKYGFSPGVYNLIFYNPDYIDESYKPPLSSYYEGTELVSFASGLDDADTLIAMSGGPGIAKGHDHLDSGSVILDKNGVRVFCDIGAENYGAANYFSSSRLYYYKARTEGHNLFVINPDNIYGSDGESIYHGQSVSGTSCVEYFDSENKIAVMNLSEAYSRDASMAKRKIYLDGDKAVIEDEIELLGDSNLIEWYFHFMDTATHRESNAVRYGAANEYYTCTISPDKKSLTLEFKEFFLNSNKRIEYTGVVNSFTVSFETDNDYEIEIRDAVRSSYDSEVITSLINSNAFSGDYYNTVNNMSKIVVKMDDASGTVKLKTIVN